MEGNTNLRGFLDKVDCAHTRSFSKIEAHQFRSEFRFAQTNITGGSDVGIKILPRISVPGGDLNVRVSVLVVDGSLDLSARATCFFI